MNKNIYIGIIVFLLGSIYHIGFLGLNEVLKVADSFAYLQMSYYLEQLVQQGLGSGWFGFFYSLPIAIVNIFLHHDFLSAKVVNIILLNISAFLLWKISKKILSDIYVFFVVILWFLSPTFLHFNIHILSENIYIPLFLGVFLTSWDLVEKILKSESSIYKEVVTIACLLGLMYLTRAEAFIYIGSIWLLAGYLVIKKTLSLKRFFLLGILFLGTFFIFISPYLIHLHSITWEWGLTNKWASNLRQANLRGIEKMDDAGFERAVAELSEDKKQLIAGFAWWMEYTKPLIDGNIKDYFHKDISWATKRILANQKKLFTQNFPEIFLWKAPQLYFSNDARFSNVFFLVFSLLPLTILLYGVYKLMREQRIFFISSLAFFLPALVFFTLFFTLNRYFIIFLPLLLVAFVYGISKMKQSLRWVFLTNIVWIFLLSTLVYYNTESPKDEYYLLKKEAGLWLQNNPVNENREVKIMERFPIVTYYSWAKTRFITPYTSDINDIYEYGSYNNLDILVVDTMDFLTYRPELKKYLETTPQDFALLQEFTNTKWQKVILYLLQK